MVGSGSLLSTPLLSDVGAKGLTTLAQEIASVEVDLKSNLPTHVGTFSIHNLGKICFSHLQLNFSSLFFKIGMYGIKSAAPIVLPPQACALALGSIVDTVVPSKDKVDGKEWQVAPILTATLSCDHRVVDGAVAAQWLAAFKRMAEDPEELLL
jgi:pyruvate dehydrogenase E2 component (dihydrolipoamide acetyltransferase)